MFQSPARHADLFRKPRALPARLAVSSAVVDPAATASRDRHAPLSLTSVPAGPDPASATSRSVIATSHRLPGPGRFCQQRGIGPTPARVHALLDGFNPRAAAVGVAVTGREGVGDVGFGLGFGVAWDWNGDPWQWCLQCLPAGVVSAGFGGAGGSMFHAVPPKDGVGKLAGVIGRNSWSANVFQIEAGRWPPEP